MSSPSNSGLSSGLLSTSTSDMADPLELFDFSQFDSKSYRSTSISGSPTTAVKPQFAMTSTAVTTPSILSTAQVLPGPSHQYDQYKQQTPFVPGALASTIAFNNSNQVAGYNLDYLSPEMGSVEDAFDFNTLPSQNINPTAMDLDFESRADASFFFESTINPNAIGGQPQTMMSPIVPSQTSNVGRMYPGMHQQAALAKAQAQQQAQRQHFIQQQQNRQNQQAKQTRPKAPMPPDPLVEQKITQLLNSMRSTASATPAESSDSTPAVQLPKLKKEEEEMDEDERLLASEEGKKLSSKARRQLRNKVSARAFRSRRKEYIFQLETEIASKVTENGNLRAQMRALIEENKRLTDFSKTLLSSPSFSDFLKALPSALLQPQPQPEPQVRGDANTFMAGPQNHPHQQIGMVMLPEQPMDLSMLTPNNSDFNYQPRVYALLETPEVSFIDTEVLGGKGSSFVESFSPEAEKDVVPVLKSPVSETTALPEASESSTGNVDGDIYDDETIITSSAPIELNTDSLIAVDIFGGIELEKALARYELVDSSEEDTVAIIAARRVERLAASLEPVLARLDTLSMA
ncbi:uncharacterized protein F4812DRAFT_455610 [Daldinia caldariorum]|uniref:uncharacterized protein n=1 Tax=Daldinia caldariorum TaxID=326644 RepID=UPI0020080A9F|nr:uncharacterized protein F4812DRAFT_455610 [Daldinia caldariorum]KAI1471495.1 hypothetical protein F4812DRAFT_455610 [Daldinia caldariorum]